MFFDLTGGEDLVLVAFGQLSANRKYSIHTYKVEENKLINLRNGERSSLDDVPSQKVILDVESLLKLRGGRIKDDNSKLEKIVNDEEYCEDIQKMWNYSRSLGDKWTKYSALLAKEFNPENDGLSVSKSISDVLTALNNASPGVKSMNDFREFLGNLSDLGMILNYSIDSNGCYFRYKSSNVKKFLIVGGDALELYTYSIMKTEYDDCLVGVFIDWDDISAGNRDVLNEVDVLAVRDNVLTFVSCKDGDVSKVKDGKEELYKLATVAKRFGGKYYKMRLIATHGVSDGMCLRAQEMGIELLSAPIC